MPLNNRDQDLRKFKTYKYIYTAFLSLLKEKDYNSISVKEIAERAEINRSTFYSHYLDKDDLLEKIVDDTLESLKKNMNLVFPGIEVIVRDKNIPHPVVKEFFKNIDNNRLFYEVMFKNKHLCNFEEKCYEIFRFPIERRLKEFFTDHKIPVKEDLFIHYMTVSTIGVVQYWLEKLPETKPEDMAGELTKIFNIEAYQLMYK